MAALRTPDPPGRSFPVGSAGRLVLIVEDNLETSDVLGRILRLRGYDVAVAVDGAEALALLQGGMRPGVIVLDLWMPNMDGRRFRERQLADPTLGYIPVIVYSVDPGDDPLPHVVGHVRKGHHDPDTLLQLIDTTVH